jgi:hypothetical protein
MIKGKGLYANYPPGPGPKAHQWLNTISPIAFIIGPVGSAKTTTGAMKCLQVTTRQHPSTKDGVRRALIVAIRMNYRRMHDTLIKSYKKMFLEASAEMGISGDGVYSGVKDGPLDHFFAWKDPVTGDRCEMKVLFRAFGDNDIESFIRGFEPTAFWPNETDELPTDCLGLLFQRAGRAYMDERPDPSVIAPAEYTKIFGDLNMPDEDNWFYNQVYLPAKEGKKPGFVIFEQPSGFSPDAENIHILRRDNPNYYKNLAEKMEAWQVRRFIENQVGLSRHGEPVYPAFSDANFAANDLDPIPGVKIVIGVDQGLTPAAIFTQKDIHGRMIVLHELTTPPQEIYGAQQLGRDVGQMMIDHYRAWCAPGGFEFSIDSAAKQRESDERAFFQRFMLGILEKLSTCPVYLCPSNNPNILHDAVNHFLRTKPMRGGGEGFVVHPRCMMIRRGGISGYRLRKVKRTDGALIYKPDKNEYSHPWNALEFAAARHHGSKLNYEEHYGRSSADPMTPAPSMGGVIRSVETIQQEEFI